MRSRKVLDSPKGKAMTRTCAYLTTMVSMLFLGLMTFATASQSEISLFPRRLFTWRDAAIIVVALVLKLSVGLVRLRQGRVFARTENLAPRTPRERVLAILLAAEAGVIEECTYRGVAFVLLTWYTGSAWFGALLSATAFGLAHLLQGNRAAFVAGLHGLADQAVVALTGYLYPAMVVHFLYDVILAGAIAARAQRREVQDSTTVVERPEVEQPDF